MPANHRDRFRRGGQGALTFFSFTIFSKVIVKVRLGADAYKVEGPIAQKGSLALEVTMATRQVPTTRHRHIYLSGVGGLGAKPADVTICD